MDRFIFVYFLKIFEEGIVEWDQYDSIVETCLKSLKKINNSRVDVYTKTIEEHVYENGNLYYWSCESGFTKVSTEQFINCDKEMNTGKEDILYALDEELRHFKRSDDSLLIMPIILSASKPGVDYNEGLNKIKNNKLFDNMLRVGIAVGDNPDMKLLMKFTGNRMAIYSPDEIDSLFRKIKWIGSGTSYQMGIESISEVDFDHIYDRSVNPLHKLLLENKGAWKSYSLMKRLVREYFSDDKLRRNLVLVCVEERIPHEMVRLEECSSEQYDSFVQRLIDAYGCQKAVAENTINMWLRALEIKKETDYCGMGDLKLSVRSYNCLKRAGINTLKELRNKTPEEMMGVRNLGRKSLEEVLAKLKELGLSLNDGTNPENTEDAEKNHPGRAKCDKLREIRKKIAEANGIDFKPAECHHKGPCLGTCPVCDEEVKYLDRELQKKKDRGEEVYLSGLSVVNSRDESDDEEFVDMGRVEKPDIDNDFQDGYQSNYKYDTPIQGRMDFDTD